MTSEEAIPYSGGCCRYSIRLLAETMYGYLPKARRLCLRTRVDKLEFSDADLSVYTYMTWQEMGVRLREIMEGCSRIAMEYSPGGAIPMAFVRGCRHRRDGAFPRVRRSVFRCTVSVCRNGVVRGIRAVARKGVCRSQRG